MAENKMEQYCKLPIPIKAYKTDKEIDIETLEGTMHASVGDYIIAGVNGELYPCKPDIFEKIYIKYGQANKMVQVAMLFGKKLGEPFIVEWDGKKVRAMFDVDYLCIMNFGYGWHGVADKILRELLTGEAEIVEE